MSDLTTKIMLDAYEQRAMATMFLSGQFQAPPQNFHNSQEVEIDIVRSDEDISIAIQDLSTGARLNDADIFTNKSFKPPLHREAGVINADDLLKRNPGQDPFESVDFQANATARGVRLGQKLSPKIQRAIELQASQVLQTGTVTLTDENGVAMYTIDYKPKATHFPTVSNNWGTAGETPFADIDSLAEVIRNDGLGDPDMLIMGSGAYENFIKNDEVLARLDNRRIEGSEIKAMERVGNGGTFRGTVEIGNYKYEIWTYGGRYKDPQTGNKIQFVATDKVIVRDSQGRMDAAFGGIPRIGQPDPRVPRELLQRVSNGENLFDMQHWAWIENDGSGLTVEVGTRPIMIPTAIDTFGCLDTQI